jgi:hypothetical protein
MQGKQQPQGDREYTTITDRRKRQSRRKKLKSSNSGNTDKEGAETL